MGFISREETRGFEEGFEEDFILGKSERIENEDTESIGVCGSVYISESVVE